MILPRVIINWPAKVLWPNEGKGRHWAAISPARKAQRAEAWAKAREAQWPNHTGPAQGVHIRVTACSPSNVSRFDLSNLLAACKGAEDGLSDALCIDDRHFTYTLRRGGKCKDGGVIIDAEIIGFPAEGDNFRTIGEVAADLVKTVVEKKAAQGVATSGLTTTPTHTKG